MENLTNSSLMDKRWVTEVAQESAKYLLYVFKNEDANVAAVVSSLAQMCIERKEALAFLNIKGFLIETGHSLPEHFNEIASDNSTFDSYCRLLIYYLLEYSGQPVE